MRRSFGFSPTKFYEPDTQVGSLKVLAELAARGSIDPLVRNTALKIVRGCKSRDDECELRALYEAVKHGDPDVAPLRSGFKYVADSRFADYFASPADSLKACMKGACGGDCFVNGTLVLRDDHQLVPIESLRVGDRIWGLNDWSKVTKTWTKGMLPTWKVILNNGTSMRFTQSHEIWIQRCRTHHETDSNCRCGVDDRDLVRIKVSELQYGMALVQPTGKPEGANREAFDKVRHQREDIDAEFLRVFGLVKDELVLDCYDIETEDHFVWLPEADWTTSQCDDHSSLLAGLAGSLGWRVGLRAWGEKNSGGYSHVYAMALYPKRPVPLRYGYTGQSSYGWKRALALDTTVDDFEMGDEPPPGEVMTAWLG